MKSHFTAIFLSVLLSLGTISAAWSADFQKGLTAYKSGDFATALREWTPLAKQGNAFAQNNLGVMYAEERGVPQNDKTAVKWYELAAKQGDADAQNNLGVMYHYGIGVPQNDKTAAKWYKLAAEQGIASAQYNLGWMYHYGVGVPQDYKTAVKWYKLAAEQGVADAQYNLGWLYAEGQGVPKNYKTAVKWYALAAEQGVATDASQHLLNKSRLVSESMDRCLLGEVAKITGPESKRIAEKYCREQSDSVWTEIKPWWKFW